MLHYDSSQCNKEKQMKFDFNKTIIVATAVLIAAAIYFNFLSGQPVVFR